MNKHYVILKNWFHRKSPMSGQFCYFLAEISVIHSSFNMLGLFNLTKMYVVTLFVFERRKNNEKSCKNYVCLKIGRMIYLEIKLIFLSF